MLKLLFNHSAIIKAVLAVFITAVTKSTGHNWIGLSEKYKEWSGLINIWSKVDGFLWISLLLLLIIFIVLDDKNTKELKKISDSMEELKKSAGSNFLMVNSIFNEILKSLVMRFRAGDRGHIRASLYFSDVVGNSFVMIGRYSSNPMYSGKGRVSYPLGEGCIHRGWENGWHFDDQVPDAANPDDRKRYLRQTYNMKGDGVKKLRMNSVIYAVARVNGVEGNSQGVLVVESIDKSNFTEGEAKALMDNMQENLSHILSSVRKYIPRPMLAKEIGL